MPTKLETYLTLQEATDRYKISAEVLTQLANSGKIRAVRLNGDGGGIAVAERDVVGQIITREQFDHLRGVELGIAEAARRYQVPHSTISRWVKAGYIAKIGQKGQKILVDEADVAYCVKVYKCQDGGQGKRIFDKDGNPYRLKNPERART